MSNSYDQLRYSFDNILKELDDICKSIDDLTDVNQLPGGQYLINNSRANGTRPVSMLADTPSNKKYKNYQLVSVDHLLNNETQSTDQHNEIDNRVKTESELFDSFNKTLNYIRPTSDSFNVRSSSIRREKQRADDQEQHKRRNEDKKIEKNRKRFFMATMPPSLSKMVGSAQETALSLFSFKTPPPTDSSTSLDLGATSSNGHRHTTNGSHNHKDTHLYSSVNTLTSQQVSRSMPGGEQSASADYSSATLPMTTNSNNSFYASQRLSLNNNQANKSGVNFKASNNYNQFGVDHEENFSKVLRQNGINYYKSGGAGGNSYYDNNEYRENYDIYENDLIKKDVEEETQYVDEEPNVDKDDDQLNPYDLGSLSSLSSSSSLDQNDRHSIDSMDRLTPDEIAKIKCFYNSMGCFVYVCRSQVELYQTKRDEYEMDSIEMDPVNEYRKYMLKRQQQLYPNSGASAASSGYFDDVFANPLNNSHSVNYMYINTGVPVIVFNYGANPKKPKDLRILLAERATGFCLYEFKFDYIAKLIDNSSSNNTSHSRIMTMMQLRLNEVSSTTTGGSSLFAESMNYHNEYFERFFNTKNRQTQKEHLFKFIFKKDCLAFCSQIMQIVDDKRNSNLFSSDFISVNVSSLVQNDPSSRPQSVAGVGDINRSMDPSMDLLASLSSILRNAAEGAYFPNRSSVILYHFDVKQINRARHKSPSVRTTTAETSYTSQAAARSTPSSHRRADFASKNRRQNLSYDQSYFRPSKYNSMLYADYDNFSTNHDGGADYSVKSLKSSPSDYIKSSLNTKTSADSKYKVRKLRKSDISSPVSFIHVTHLDRPVAIGKRYKVNY